MSKIVDEVFQLIANKAKQGDKEFTILSSENESFKQIMGNENLLTEFNRKNKEAGWSCEINNSLVFALSEEEYSKIIEESVPYYIPKEEIKVIGGYGMVIPKFNILNALDNCNTLEEYSNYLKSNRKITHWI